MSTPYETPVPLAPPSNPPASWQPGMPGGLPEPPSVVRPKVKAPAGMVFVKDPARPGKFKLVKKAGSGSGGAKPKPKAKKKPISYVQGEINRQIEQDLHLTNFTDEHTAAISKLMADQANAAAQVAGQFAPVTTFDNPTLDAHAQARVAADVGLTNAVVGDQAKALAQLTARGGVTGANLANNMRGAARLQHRDYARYVQALRPTLENKRAQELLAMETQRTQNQLAKDQFGLQKDQFSEGVRQFDESSAAAAAAGSEGTSSGGGGRANSGMSSPAIQQRLDAIRGVWSTRSLPAQKDGESDKAYKARTKHWRTRNAFNELRSAGLSDTVAATQALSWNNTNGYWRNQGTYRAHEALKNMGATPNARKVAIIKLFGKKEWDKLSKVLSQPVTVVNPNPSPGGNFTTVQVD